MSTVRIRVVLSFRRPVPLFVDFEPHGPTVTWFDELDAADDEDEVGGGRNGILVLVAKKKQIKWYESLRILSINSIDFEFNSQ